MTTPARTPSPAVAARAVIPPEAPGAGFRDDPVIPDAERESRPRTAVVARAVAGCVVAWLALVVTVSAIGEIAASPTWAPGVLSSTWTPLRGVGAFIVGAQAYGGGFSPLPILYGLGGTLAYSLVFGLGAAALIVAAQGPRPSALGAMLQGACTGIAMEAFLVNVAVNWIQAQPTVYESLPSWGWWAGHVAWGLALGRALA